LPHKLEGQIISALKEHPLFDGGYEYDIALVKFAQKVSFNNYIKPICMKDYVHKNKGGFNCFAAGWGMNSQTMSTRQAHSAKINIINDGYCSNTYRKKYNTQQMVCTGGDNRPCQERDKISTC
jgi:hypothetical protein